MMSFGVPLRREQTEPAGHMETSHATLIRSWNVGHCRRALWREVRNRLNRATPHLGQCNSGLGDHKVEDLPGDQVRHGGTGTAVGDELQARANHE